jgi:hypothetical protein
MLSSRPKQVHRKVSLRSGGICGSNKQAILRKAKDHQPTTGVQQKETNALPT